MLEKIKNIKWAYIAFAVLFIGVGLCFVISPEKSVKYTGIAIGLFVALFAILKFVLLLSEKERRFWFFFRAVFFVCAAICGIFFAFSPYRTVPFISSALGLILIMDGSFKLQTSVLAKRYNLTAWWFILVFSITAIVGGFLAVRGVFESNLKLTVILLGIFLIVDGVQNFLSLFYFGGIDRGTKEEALLEVEEKTILPAESEASVPEENEKNSDVNES